VGKRRVEVNKELTKMVDNKMNNALEEMRIMIERMMANK